IGRTDDDGDKSRPAVPADDREMQSVVLAEMHVADQHVRRGDRQPGARSLEGRGMLGFEAGLAQQPLHTCARIRVWRNYKDPACHSLSRFRSRISPVIGDVEDVERRLKATRVPDERRPSRLTFRTFFPEKWAD